MRLLKLYRDTIVNFTVHLNHWPTLLGGRHVYYLAHLTYSSATNQINPAGGWLWVFTTGSVTHAKSCVNKDILKHASFALKISRGMVCYVIMVVPNDVQPRLLHYNGKVKRKSDAKNVAINMFVYVFVLTQSRPCAILYP